MTHGVQGLLPGQDRSFVSHVLRLTLLAPELIVAILDGKQPATLQLQPLMRGFPVEWEKQRCMYG